MYETLDRSEDNVIGIRISGKLTAEDFDRLVPLLEAKSAQYGKLRVLFLMNDWHGWDSLKTLWRDIKADVRFNKKVERLAMVGEANWERIMAEITRPLARGEVRYFDASELEKAWTWIREGLPHGTGTD